MLVDESPEFFVEGLQRWYGGDGLAMAADYFRHLAQDVPHFRPDIIGHFDLVRKFNRADRYFDENCRAYRRAALEAAEAAGETGAVFEVSTVNLNRKRRRILFPADFILRFFLEKGYPVTLSSDAHDPDLICGHFGYAVQHLRELGFRSVMVWRNGGFNEVSLPG
jgi:histidinol-phosphatase (PHP family)